MAGVAGSQQSQPTKDHGDQPEHEGRSAPDYSIAAAETTCGDSQIQSTVDAGNQPGYQGREGSPSAVTGAGVTGRSAQSQPSDDHADQSQRSHRRGPESPGCRTLNRGSGWLGNVCGHQHGIHKTAE